MVKCTDTVSWFSPDIHYTSAELKKVAKTLKSEQRRVDDLLTYLLDFYSDRSPEIKEVREYQKRLANTQYIVARDL